MINFAQLGNDLYTGRRSVNFIGRQKVWYSVSAVLILISLFGVFGRGPNFGIEFHGGSEFRVSDVHDTADYEAKAKKAVGDSGIDGNVLTTVISDPTSGKKSVRVQTSAAGDRSEAAAAALGQSFGVEKTSVSSSFIDASWGESVSREAIRALIIFVILVGLVMAVYFRTWKMAVAALLALFHDLIITFGVYCLTGLEITPSSMIGFLTILGYSLYDTVVVFDKIRENTDTAVTTKRTSFASAANLAVNQTLVRSINTTVVALLPIAAVLVIGFTMLGPGTLLDLSLALFIGIAAGAYSSIFIAPPVFVDLKNLEPEIKDLAKHAERQQAKAKQLAGARQTTLSEDLDADSNPIDGPDSAVLGRLASRPVHKYAQSSGPRNQPRRAPKSKR